MINKDFDQFDSETVRILRGVRMFAHQDLPAAIGVIELRFEGFKVLVCIEDEYDTLLCTRTIPESHLAYKIPIYSSFWDSIVGKTLVGAWQMKNDRGYSDALQLRFRDLPNAGDYTLVQLYGEASEIVISKLNEVRAEISDQS